MDSTVFTNEHAQEFVDAQAHIWTHIFNFVNSMSLKCAIELGIPDAIERHGKPITLSELSTSLDLHPTKASHLNRLMRLLVHSNFFSKKNLSNGDAVFGLTLNSRLLLKNHPFSQAPFAITVLSQTLVTPGHHMSTWFRNDSESPFSIAHGRSIWEHAESVDTFNSELNQGMASDARFVGRLLTANRALCKALFKGVKSLVDVGGGDGTIAKAIAEAFPEVQCMVLDQPHVVQGLQGNACNLEYVAGNMFREIPCAQVVLLKWILHDWSDEHCLQILRNCKNAIPTKDQGGKVIIIDTVLDDQNDAHYQQIMYDMEMMTMTNGGKERSEEEWKKLFLDAGFGCDYKVFPVLSPRSIIEIYPC